MASSYSPRLRFEEQLTGENTNTWGLKLSNTLARVDDAIAGYVAVALTATTYTLTSSNDNTSADEARMASVKFTGSPSGTATVTIPSVGKVYWIWNATTVSVIITTGSGNTVTIPTGDIAPIFCDGTNVKTVTISTYGIKDYVDSVAWTYNAGALPSQTGNAGKFVTTNGTTASWANVTTADISDYATAIKGLALAFAVAL